MKKKHFIFLIIALVLLVVLITSFNYFKTTNTYVEDNINNQTKIIKQLLRVDGQQKVINLIQNYQDVKMEVNLVGMIQKKQ